MSYDTEEDAAHVYDEEAQKLYGEFAYLNFFNVRKQKDLSDD